MPNAENSVKSRGRRGFLGRVLGLTATTLTATVTTSAGADQENAPSPETQTGNSQGYRLSEHIRKYYDSARS